MDHTFTWCVLAHCSDYTIQVSKLPIFYQREWIWISKNLNYFLEEIVSTKLIKLCPYSETVLCRWGLTEHLQVKACLSACLPVPSRTKSLMSWSFWEEPLCKAPPQILSCNFCDYTKTTWCYGKIFTSPGSRSNSPLHELCDLGEAV